MQDRKPKNLEEMFKEDPENGFIDMAIDGQKLKSTFALDMFDRKKEKAILDSLTYKIKNVVEIRQSLMSQIRMKLKIGRISVAKPIIGKLS